MRDVAINVLASVLEKELVSVIIPAYNARAWVADSVKSALDQSYPAVEIIVIDDGSSDSTAELVAAKFGSAVHLLRQANQGQAHATATGMAVARGQWIAFLDSDDLWDAGKLAAQVEYLGRHPEIAAVYSDAEEFREWGVDHQSYIQKHAALRDPARVVQAIVGRHVPLRSTVMLRKAFLVEHGIQVDTQSGSVDDIGLFLEIAARGGRFGWIDRVTTFRRMHDQNFSRGHLKRFTSRIPMYHRLLARCQNAPADWKREVRKALADAEFRVGEHHFGLTELATARVHFRRALEADPRHRGARIGLCYCTLPRNLLLAARSMKHWIRGVPTKAPPVPPTETK